MGNDKFAVFFDLGWKILIFPFGHFKFCIEIQILSSQFGTELGLADGASTVPQFAYSGPRAHAVIPEKGIWLHLTGSNAVGLTGISFNGQLWALSELRNERPKWTRLEMEVPKTDSTNLHVHYLHETREIIIASESRGILKAVLNVS